MGFEVPSRVVYTRKSLSNRADAKDRQDVAQTRAAPAKLVRITGAFFRSCRGVQQQSEIDHEKSVWVQGLRNHHNCTVSSTWQPSGAKTNPQILRMRQKNRYPSKKSRQSQFVLILQMLKQMDGRHKSSEMLDPPETQLKRQPLSGNLGRLELAKLIAELVRTVLRV